VGIEGKKTVAKVPETSVPESAAYKR
jgi:hypothetical protein